MGNRKSVLLTVLSLFALCSLSAPFQSSFAQTSEPSVRERYHAATMEYCRP
ncbi:MAG: hypothetical protein HGA78_00560 [Nitrospirales bacterium]|nr:hypothetical protein [Nitrospirales bacterium]